MPLPDFNSIKKLSEIEINDEISNLKKELFNLRLRKATTRKTLKPNLFKNLKRKIAQLLTLKIHKKITQN